MTDDLTDALRRIIEPMKGTLISAAQAHYLASIQAELSDAHRHTERALELIGDLIPEGTEPHWNIRPEYAETYTKPQGNLAEWARETVAKNPPPAGPEETERRWNQIMGTPPPDEPPGGITRDTPKPGEIWTFTQGTRWTKDVVAQIENPEPGQPVELAMVTFGVSAGEFFKFNALDDPMPVRRLGKGYVLRPEDVTPEGSPAGTPFTPYTDDSAAYQRMTEETDTI